VIGPDERAGQARAVTTARSAPIKSQYGGNWPYWQGANSGNLAACRAA
jgi:hypothetical protein